MANDRSKDKTDFRNYATEYEFETALIEEGRAADRTAARKKVFQLIPKENTYQRKILRALEREFPTGRWRKNAAGFGQASGEPDVDGVLDGRFIAIEVKRPLIGKLTALQRKAIREIRAAGGCAMVASYADEVVAAVREYMDARPYYYLLTGAQSWKEEDDG